MSYTIYDDKIWQRILEKHPDLRKLAIKTGVENDPKKAKEIRKKFSHNFGSNELSETEQSFARKLCSVEFIEQGFLDGVVLKGSFAHSVGADEDALVSFEMVLEDFNWTFRDFIDTCKKRNENLENISFGNAYEIFLEVIVLKLKYKIPYTKLFIKKLLEMSYSKEEDILEIKNYFLENDPTILKEISQELLVDNSK